MAGLLSASAMQGAPPGRQPAAGAPTGQGGPGLAGAAAPADEEQPNVSPELQAQYDTFVRNGMEIMYSEQVMPKLLEAIRSVGDPVEGLGNAVATLVMRLDESAEQAGTEISGDVKLHGALELLEQMAELAEAAGVHEYAPEELEGAFYAAMDAYRVALQAQGKIRPEEYQADLQELQRAEQEGRIDEILPGISEYAARAQQQQPAGNGGGAQQQDRRA